MARATHLIGSVFALGICIFLFTKGQDIFSLTFLSSLQAVLDKTGIYFDLLTRPWIGDVLGWSAILILFVMGCIGLYKVIFFEKQV